MYCAACGSELKIGLNYCNRCGARVSQADAEARRSATDNLSNSLGAVGVFGLIGYVVLTIFLVKSDAHPGSLVLISLFYLATLFGICFMILRQLKAIPGKSSAQNIDFQNNFQAEQINAANTAQLEEPKQQPISVTEHTTRTLDKVESKFKG